MTEDKIVDLRDGLRWGLSSNLGLGDDDLEYNLFEQFDAFVRTDLHPDNLRPLTNIGLLSSEENTLMQQLRTVWLENCDNERTAEASRRQESPIRRAFAITDDLWIRLETRLKIAGRPTEPHSSNEDTRPAVLPTR